MAATAWTEFVGRFGGAFRTKHVNSPLAPVLGKMRTNKRVHFMKEKTEIPAEFIRLEPWEGEFLFMVAARARLGILEIGRFNGGSAFLMAFANRTVPIHSIDLKPKNDEFLLKTFDSVGIGQNVGLIVGDSQSTTYPQVGGIDLLFIDGDHSYAGCTRDLENWYPSVASGGHIVLHDCYHGSPVLDAVIDFTRDREVTLMRSPYVLSAHWTYPTGSMMHFIKRA
jgi:predicted O-methyltransferase YrrM